MIGDVVARERADHEAARRPIREYASLIPEQDGELDLSPGGSFAFQVEPFYSDEVAAAAEVVIKKSSQIGATAGMWRWSFREADQFGRRVIYTFPTDKHVTDFGDERIEPAVEESEYLQRRIPPGYVKNKHLKRVGRGFLYLRGANSKSGAQSVAAQSIVFDEYDLLDEGNLRQFERRLRGARARGRAPRLRRLGNPTLPGYGIDAAYDSSDRREWIVTCENCGAEQTVDWAKNVRWSMPGEDEVYRPGHDSETARTHPHVVGDVWRVCGECEESIEGDALKGGRWVAQNPESPIIGYFIHQLLVPDADLAELVKASRQTKPHELEAFYNNDLGLAWVSADSQLTDRDLDAACSLGGDPVESYNGPYPTTGGLDIASERECSMRVSEQLPDGTRRALLIKSIRADDAFRQVCDIMRAFRIEMLAIDHLPESQMARAIAAQFPGRAVLVKYDDKPDAEAVRYNPDTNKATTNRTEALDAMMDSVRQLRNVPLRTPPPGYYEQMKAPKRRYEVDEKKQIVVKRYISTGADDFAHAETYDGVATEMLRLKVAAGYELATQERRVSDQDLGFRRARLDTDEDRYEGGFGMSDEYEGGFGEKW